MSKSQESLSEQHCPGGLAHDVWPKYLCIYIL